MFAFTVGGTSEPLCTHISQLPYLQSGLQAVRLRGRKEIIRSATRSVPHVPMLALSSPLTHSAPEYVSCAMSTLLFQAQDGQRN